MKKDNTRDYITSAFRLYARWGERSAKEVEEIVNECDANELPADLGALLADVDAVDKMMKLYSDEGKPEVIAAVRAVYFYRAKAPLRSGEISGRVRRHACEAHCCEKEVYRMLAEARQRAARIRGLRIE